MRQHAIDHNQRSLPHRFNTLHKLLHHHVSLRNHLIKVPLSSMPLFSIQIKRASPKRPRPNRWLDHNPFPPACRAQQKYILCTTRFKENSGHNRHSPRSEFPQIPLVQIPLHRRRRIQQRRQSIHPINPRPKRIQMLDVVPGRPDHRDIKPRPIHRRIVPRDHLRIVSRSNQPINQRFLVMIGLRKHHTAHIRNLHIRLQIRHQPLRRPTIDEHS